MTLPTLPPDTGSNRRLTRASRWRHRARARLFGLAILLALVTLIPVRSASAQAGGGGPPPANVAVDESKLELLEQRREVTGALRSPRRSLLASQQAGLVIDLKLDEGDSVAAGQVIARLDPKLAELTVTREEATTLARRGSVTEREAQLEKAKRDQSRVEELVAKSSAGPLEADDARTNVKLAEARLAQAKADLTTAEGDLALARERLRQMSVVAPFAGRVVKRWTQVGQWVQSGDGVVEIVALDTIEARLDVPENLLSRLIEASSSTSGPPGSQVETQQRSLEASAPAGRTPMSIVVRVRALNEDFEAPMGQIVPDADPLSRLFPVRVFITNPGERLKPGMSVVAAIPNGVQERLLTVRKDALLRDDAGEFLYYEANGVAAVARVKSLFAIGNRVALDKDTRLPPGARVVVEGNERLYPTQPLNILNAPASTKPPASPEADAKK